MRIKNIELDTDEVPSVVTVVMTVQEAAFIARLSGRVTTSMDVFPDTPGAEVAANTVDRALTGGLFNLFWEAGLDGYVRGDKQ